MTLIPEASHFAKFVVTGETRAELAYYQSPESLHKQINLEVKAILARTPTAKITFPTSEIYTVKY